MSDHSAPYNYFCCYATYVTSYVLQPKSVKKRYSGRAVVVAQLVERSLPIPEVRSSNTVIGKFILDICLRLTVLKGQKFKKKEAGIGRFLRKRYR